MQFIYFVIFKFNNCEFITITQHLINFFDIRIKCKKMFEFYKIMKYYNSR